MNTINAIKLEPINYFLESYASMATNAARRTTRIEAATSAEGTKGTRTKAATSLNSRTTTTANKADINNASRFVGSQPGGLAEAAAEVAMPLNRIENHVGQWTTLPDIDAYLLSVVENGYRVPFEPLPEYLDMGDSAKGTKNLPVLKSIVQDYLQRGVISKSKSVHGESVCRLFLRGKPDGTFRPILNLKPVNEFLTTEHFKLEKFDYAISLFEQGYYMTVTDLTDAYLAVMIHPDSRKHLKFRVRGQLYEFNRLVFGLATAPWLFTKLLKPVIEHMRSVGILCVIYLDDIFICGKTQTEVENQTQFMRNFLRSLGFIISPKSSQNASQEVKFLGFMINSIEMRVSLPQKKENKLKQVANALSDKNDLMLRTIMSFVGTVISDIPAIPTAKLYTRYLQSIIVKAQYCDPIPLDDQFAITDEARQELKYFAQLPKAHCSRPIKELVPTITVKTDSSDYAYGAICNGESFLGTWPPNILDKHINYKELLTIYWTLLHFKLTLKGKSVLFLTDNTTAMWYLIKQGGTKVPELCELSIDIWNTCLEYEITPKFQHIPGEKNTEADYLSRAPTDCSEWSLKDAIANEIISDFGLTIDIFASTLNNKLPRFVTWWPQPGAVASDALSIPWANERIYMFPPIPLIFKAVLKARREQVFAVLVAPDWPASIWYPLVQRMLTEAPRRLPFSNQLVVDAMTGASHPMGVHLKLTAFPIHVSGGWFQPPMLNT